MAHVRERPAPVAPFGHPHQAVGAVAVAAFCTVLAGVNLPNPLVPLYVDRYGLSPLAQSTLFGLYLLALVLTLVFILSRSERNAASGERAAAILMTALLLTIAADVLMVFGAEVLPFLLAGRMVSGVGVALATGASATLALAGLGEQARTVVASGAVIGSLIGNVGGGFLGSVLPTPQTLVFVAHLALTALVLAVLVLLSRAPRSSAPKARAGERSGALWKADYGPRHRAAGLLLGAMAWSAAGVVLALVPGALRSAVPSMSLLAAVFPGGAFLTAAWVGQVICGRRLLRMRAWQLSIPVVGGMAMIALALETADLTLLVAGAIVCGSGQGPAYSLGLATVTHGLSAGHQGRSASVFAAIAYGTCGVVTIATGALARAVGVPSAVEALTVVLAGVALIVAALAGRPQPIRPLASA
ncbi:MFS transporter [Kineosporia rhizophila]|uniref:MFS transporter n=1 Tax=Kineosporia rhizophila TaxID=84633 RepID=UPI001E347BB2|nr:MFS transporter [Kineosporia rhizophila]MCE0535440.1 MFS transporter [Kineosporia rhizophila]